ncbi:acyltransferase [Microbacterium sp. CIAB417]|uniref:acyltransferase family protein n=1 Tax=Microbacterium sp. CIAB417 TaxID=2860287 RepID=UPI001FACA657|nr:acyltransferase [Microbacterium sp. CIAB417]
MTIVERPVAAAPPSPRADLRDTGIDLVRALCIIAVVVLHALMVGVTVADTGPVFANASEGSWWITPLSWMLQVMPLFFVIGGFAGWTALRRSQRRGGTAAAFVSGRLHRLLLPALAVIATVGTALLLLAVTGVPADLLHIAGYRYAQPLWFLGTFLLCQALLPVLARAHDRAPLGSLAVLAALAAGIDVLRLLTGVEALGFANLAFVWLTLQQLGFHLADGRIDALSRRARVRIALGAVAVLVISMLCGIHSPDLIANLNPPTTALILVGLAHTMVLSLLRERLSVWSRRPALTALHTFVNRRAMTIYLWHMPVLLATAGVLALWALGAGTPLPAPGSAEWWLTRPIWLIATLVLTAAVAVPLARLESRRAPAAHATGARLVLGTLCGLVAVVLLLVAGTDPATALAASALIVAALQLARAPRVRSRSTPDDAERIRG